MKKQVLFTLCLLPLMASAQMNITANEQVSSELTPNVLRVQISFEETNKNSDVIKEHLNALVSTLKNFDAKGEFCRGGGYFLSPQYSYKDQKQTFIGYSGQLSFGCEFDAIERYNALLLKIDASKAHNIRMNQGALAWGTSDKAQDLARLTLRLELLKIAQGQAKTFSKEVDMQCSVNSVAFEGTQPVQPMMSAMRLKTFASPKNESVPTEEPLQRNEILTLTATVNYTCSNLPAK